MDCKSRGSQRRRPLALYLAHVVLLPNYQEDEASFREFLKALLRYLHSMLYFEVQRTHYPTPMGLPASPARPQDGVHVEMLSQHGRSPERSVLIGVGKAGSHYNEDIIAADHPPGILERLLAHLHQCELSSVFMIVGYVQTPVTFESQLSIGVGSAVDSSRTKARLFVILQAS